MHSGESSTFKNETQNFKDKFSENFKYDKKSEATKTSATQLRLEEDSSEHNCVGFSQIRPKEMASTSVNGAKKVQKSTAKSNFQTSIPTERVKSLARLSPTPSMTMLSQAAEALSQSPTALKKLADGTSTGGVYQLSHKQLQPCKPSKAKRSSVTNLSINASDLGVSNGDFDAESSCKQSLSALSPQFAKKKSKLAAEESRRSDFDKSGSASLNSRSKYLSHSNSNSSSSSSSMASTLKSSSKSSSATKNSEKSASRELKINGGKLTHCCSNYEFDLSTMKNSSVRSFGGRRKKSSFYFGERELQRACSNDFEYSTGNATELETKHDHEREIVKTNQTESEKEKKRTASSETEVEFDDELNELSNGFDKVLLNVGEKFAGSSEFFDQEPVTLEEVCETYMGDLDKELVVMRHNLQRKRSFSASFVSEFHEEVMAVTSNVAIFKPCDEETGWSTLNGSTSSELSEASHNSRKEVRKLTLKSGDREVYVNPERKGLVIGTGSVRERAAYLLESNYSSSSSGQFESRFDSLLSVPTTMLTKLVTTKNGQITVKKGSLQKYVVHKDSADCAPDLVNKASPLEVHKIGILDLRIFNTDRHGGNILCSVESDDHDDEDTETEARNERVSLWPIDHALSLPDFRYMSEAFFDWQFYPQAKISFDETTLEFIEALDVDQDEEILEDLGLSEGSRLTNKICTLALKYGAKHGLNLYELALMFCRPFPAGHSKHLDFESPLEHMVKIAIQQVQILNIPETALTTCVRLAPKSVAGLKSNSQLFKKKIWPNNSSSTEGEKCASGERRSCHVSTKHERMKTSGIASQIERVRTLQKYSQSDCVKFNLIVEGNVNVSSESELENKINCEFDFGEASDLPAVGYSEETSFRAPVLMKRCKSEDHNDFLCSNPVNTISDNPIDINGEKPLSTNEVSNIIKLKDSVKIQQDVEIIDEGSPFGEIEFDKQEFFKYFQSVLRRYVPDGSWKQWLK